MAEHKKLSFVLSVYIVFISVCNAKSIVRHDIDWNTYPNPELSSLFEGDIILGKLTGKPGLRNEKYRWEKNTLVYTIGSGFNNEEQELIADAIVELTTKTCIKFVKRTSEEDYVEVVPASEGCSSSVGRQGGRQTVNLAKSCFAVGKGTIVHEFIHSLGFHHEHTRPDRDDYVRINVERIQPHAQNNFKKDRKSDYNDFGVSYDYGSIMHYPKYAFGLWPGAETITVRQRGATIGQRIEMSSKDVQKLRNMYKC